MIDEVFDASNDVASARSVYLALTQIASDEQSETFTRRIREIALTAAVSYRTTFHMLKRFEVLYIVRVKRNYVAGTKENAPSTYTLCNGCITLCNSRIQASLPRVQKNLRTGTARRGKSLEESVQGTVHGKNVINTSTTCSTGESFDEETGEYNF